MITGEKQTDYQRRVGAPHQVFVWCRDLYDGRTAWFQKVWRVWWEDPAANWAQDLSCWRHFETEEEAAKCK